VSEPEPAARIATPADRPLVVGTLVAAFRDDPLARWSFPEQERFEAGVTDFFGYLFDLRVPDGGVLVADGAASLWTPPGGVSMDRARQDDLWTTDVERSLLADELRRMDEFDDTVDAIHPSTPHWYLGVLGTEPASRGRGRARAVLEPVLARADGDRVPAFLETATFENLAFYERFGFGVLAEADVPGGPHIWGLWRLPART
jgi:GNAT superfamily N-acetyltransferase